MEQIKAHNKKEHLIVETRKLLIKKDKSLAINNKINNKRKNKTSSKAFHYKKMKIAIQ
jgi:hypothetical protein